MKTERIDRLTSLSFIQERHYAISNPQVTLAFGWFDDKDVLQAVCTIGKPASHRACILCGEKYAPNVYELNRLVRNEDFTEYPLSMFVSSILRELKKLDWIIVSYADTAMNHTGYIYQACNFLYTGYSRKHYSRVVIGKNGNVLHGRRCYGKWLAKDSVIIQGIHKVNSPKHRYVYFCSSDKKLKREWKTLLKYKVLPYPKEVNKNYILGEKYHGCFIDENGNNIEFSMAQKKEYIQEYFPLFLEDFTGQKLG